MKSIQKYYEIPFLLLFSTVALTLGLFLPVITLKELVFWTHTFSVYTGILTLQGERQYVLAMVIFVFSILFPLLKLGTLWVLWIFNASKEKSLWLVKWLGILGKWSMLDVFVVAITIVIAKISSFASAEPRIGIYFFGSSILLAMIATMRTEKRLKQQPR